MSQHIINTQYHPISTTIHYSFVRAKVVPQTRTTAVPYTTWVCINAQNFVAADCTCQGGANGLCKHVAGLMFFVVSNVISSDSVTSKPQQWHIPSASAKRLHQPDFISNIAIKKVSGDATLPSQISTPRPSRSEYDPRSIKFRNSKPLQDLELDRLADITGGNCGLLLYTPRVPDPSRSIPNIADVTMVETVETSSHLCSIQEATSHLDLKCPSALETVLNATTVSITDKALIETLTRGQADCVLWKKLRLGRITASKVSQCMKHINEAGNVVGATHSTVAALFGYYGDVMSNATSWGKSREARSCNLYKAIHLSKHRKVKVSSCGLHISQTAGFIAGTPDALVDCPMCGTGVLEVKNPYKYRSCTITEYATKPDSCLSTSADGLIQLTETHAYYGQVIVECCSSCSLFLFVVTVHNCSENIPCRTTITKT